MKVSLAGGGVALSLCCFLNAFADEQPSLSRAIDDALSAEQPIDLKVIDAALSAADRETYLTSSEALIALGWDKEFEAVGNNLEKFSEHHPQFKEFLQGTALLTLSEDLSLLERMESTLGPILESKTGVASYLGAVGIAAVFGALKAKLSIYAASVAVTPAFEFMASGVGFQAANTAAILSTGGYYALAVAAIGAVLVGGYYGKKFISSKIWGNQILFVDYIDAEQLSNTHAHVYCTNAENPEMRFWLSKKDESVIDGSFGHDENTKHEGFATRESPAKLLSSCAREMRERFHINKLLPSDVLPMVGVSLANTRYLYSAYPIVYYSKFLGPDGKSVRLSRYFAQ